MAKPYHQQEADFKFYFGAAEYYTGDKESGMEWWKKAARAGHQTTREFLDSNGISY